MTVKLRNPTDTYGNCTICRAYCVHRTHHTCPPVWRVRVDGEDDDSASQIFARDAEEAAERFCERHDSDLDYSIIRAGRATLFVEGGGKTVRVEIEAETRPEYTARVCEDDDVDLAALEQGS